MEIWGEKGLEVGQRGRWSLVEEEQGLGSFWWLSERQREWSVFEC